MSLSLASSTVCDHRACEHLSNDEWRRRLRHATVDHSPTHHHHRTLSVDSSESITSIHQSGTRPRHSLLSPVHWLLVESTIRQSIPRRYVSAEQRRPGDDVPLPGWAPRLIGAVRQRMTHRRRSTPAATYWPSTAHLSSSPHISLTLHRIPCLPSTAHDYISNICLQHVTWQLLPLRLQLSLDQHILHPLHQHA